MYDSSKIAVVSNLTSGGSVVYMKNVLSNMYTVPTNKYSPRKFKASNNKLANFLYYLKYLYIDLFIDYFLISKKINSDPEIDKVILFQDAYTKSPYLLLFLKKKSVYILHEPPREFYEDYLMHAPTISNRVFNVLCRLPVKYIDLFLTKRASKIISNSKYSQKIIRNIYQTESTLIYPGTKTKHIKAGAKRENTCISIGSLLPYKGHKTVIEEISKIRKNRPNLVIIGDGTSRQKNELQKIAIERDVSLLVKNNLSDYDLESEFLKAKVYINGAYYEPFGLAALESISYGCNLVTNETGGTKEIQKFFPEKVIVSKENIAKSIEIAINKNNEIPDMKHFNWKNITNKIINS